MCLLCTCGCLLTCYRNKKKASASVDDIHSSRHPSKREREESAREHVDDAEEAEEEEEGDEEEARTPRRSADSLVDLVNEDSMDHVDIDIESHTSHGRNEAALRSARDRVLAGLSAGVLVLRHDEEDKDDGNDRVSLADNSDDFSITFDFGKQDCVSYSNHHPLIVGIL